jgi:hypothetical protein
MRALCPSLPGQGGFNAPRAVDVQRMPASCRTGGPFTGTCRGCRCLCHVQYSNEGDRFLPTSTEYHSTIFVPTLAALSSVLWREHSIPTAAFNSYNAQWGLWSNFSVIPSVALLNAPRLRSLVQVVQPEVFDLPPPIIAGRAPSVTEGRHRTRVLHHLPGTIPL